MTAPDDPPSPLQDWLTIWASELAARAADPDTRRLWALAGWPAGHDAGADAAAGATAARLLSELAGRLDRLERRVADLERDRR